MHSFKGMTQDLSISKANSDYYFDAFNIRITARENNTLMSVTNEKGNVPMKDSGGNNITFEGTYLGHAVINKYLVLFTTNNEGVDRIYRFLYDGSVMTTTKLFEGNLGFDVEHPIETLTDYENEDVQKVYWTDGKNQPRVINIIGEISDSNTQFDFSSALELKEEVTITKNIGEGLYTAGTIQYLFTYLNQFGIESKPFYVSPLYYITHSNRGAVADTSVSNNFTIRIDNIDTQAKYLNIYSIHRSSEGTTPEVKLVARVHPDITATTTTMYTWFVSNPAVTIRRYNNQGFIEEVNLSINSSTDVTYTDCTYIIITVSGNSYRINIPRGSNGIRLKINPTDISELQCFLGSGGEFEVYTPLTYIDKGDTGESVNPTDLYYLGAENIVAQTMTDKDQTLFLGNIELKNLKPSDELKAACRELTVTWENKEGIDLADVTNTYYKYNIQLHRSSQDVKTFKYGETYRLGLQFQDTNGVWSEPLWVCDSVNDVHVKYNTDGTKFELVGAEANLTSLTNIATSLGYKKARPVVAEAGILDRTCLCQGILCPTVFNVEDRAQNAPFAQSSWYARPDITVQLGCYSYIFKPISTPIINESIVGQSISVTATDSTTVYWFRVDSLITSGSRAGDLTVHLESISSAPTSSPEYLNGLNVKDPPTGIPALPTTFSVSDYDYECSEALWRWNNPFRMPYTLDKGNYNEFRHNESLPSSGSFNSEIQNSGIVPKTYSSGVYLDFTKGNENANQSIITEWSNANSHNFFVDRSVVTLHSPDLEMSESLFSIDTTPYKLRIIGIAELSGFISDTNIQVKSGPNNFYELVQADVNSVPAKATFTASDEVASGLYDTNIGVYNIDNLYGGNSRISTPCWIDSPMQKYTDMENKTQYTPTPFKASYIVYPWHRSGPLNNSGVDAQKSTSILESKQLSNLRFAAYTKYLDYNDIDEGNLDVSGISLFNNTDSNIIKIPAPKNSGLPDLVYEGEFDKIITSGSTYPIYFSGIANSSYFDHKIVGKERFSNYADVFSRVATPSESGSNYVCNITPTEGSEGVRIAYKSTPHYVMGLNYISENNPVILPTLGNFNTPIVPHELNLSSNMDYYPYWKGSIIDSDESAYNISQSVLDPTWFDESYTQEFLKANPISYLFIGEIYNDNVQNRFGGTSDIAIQNNKWIPAGEPIDLTNSTVVKWTEGDTYFQRYDCLKTYPYSLEYTNSMTEIVSFMCETRVNIDGRTDRNRGQTNNLTMTPENFNLINEGYTQSNQFFNYKQLDDRFKLNKFPSQITWTTSKTAGALVDNWTRVTLANTLDLEGSLGEVTALEKLGDNVIAFQTDGISHIIYNPNVQINTTNGLPIEIANSGKVQGKRYLQRNVGCQNKWSIVTSDKEIYFIDNNKKSIYALSTDGSLISLTSKLGMSKWMSDNNSNKVWNPRDAENFRTYYDRGHDDVYFVNKDTCLCFSAPISQFTSFMSYNNVPAMFNIDDELFSIYGDKIWNHFKGNYNSFYEETKPYYITVIDNDNEPYTKTYNTIEYRGDVYKNGKLQNFNTFDTVRVSNEYQDTQEVSIARTFNRPSSLSKKFRIWRISIPRDASNHRDRIVNPWVKITLKKQYPENENIELHDLAVEYFL